MRKTAERKLLFTEWLSTRAGYEQNFISELYDEWPNFVCRDYVEKLTGGWIKAKTLKRDDCLNIGPVERFETKNGKQIFYPKEALIQYAIIRFGVNQIKTDRYYIALEKRLADVCC